MIRNLAKTFCILAVVGCAPLLRAQLVNDFSNFADGNQSFLGTWAANGDPFFGDTSPIGSFSQGSGVYNFTGGSDDISSGAEYFLASSIDLSASNALALTLKLLPATDTETDAIAVTLYDQASNFAVATFQLSNFNGSTFTTSTVGWVSDGSFDSSHVAYYLISGLSAVGGNGVDVSIDHLSAVPEPGTYAAIAGVAALGLVAWRRRRTA